jgi:tetratricopeptide (TPR) repeat protein
MAGVSAGKKRIGAKARKVARPRKKAPSKRAVKPKSFPRKKLSSPVKAGGKKSKQKLAGKAKKRRPVHVRARRPSTSVESGKMTSARRKQISFGVPTPPPEKPPPLLKDSRNTSAALALLEKGIKLIYQKEFKRARVEFKSIGETYPGEPEIIARALSYLQICDREEAAHRKPSVTQDQLYGLGVMEHNRGNYDGAISYFRQSLERNKDADYVYYSLAASQALKNDVNAAVENLRKAIELNEDNRVYAKNDPDFDPLHAQKEFTDLVGLNPAPPLESTQS